MRIVDRFSFAGALMILQSDHSIELAEVEEAILAIDAESCRVKESNESRRVEEGLLYAPSALNYCLLQKQLYKSGWDSSSRKRAIIQHFASTSIQRRIPMSMDGIKNRVGLESQLGKYAFLEYDVLAKMPIYQRQGLIDVGIEIVQVRRMALQMSSGVGDFERLVTNLVHRGERPGDFPVLVLGIDADPMNEGQGSSVFFQNEIPINRETTRPGPKGYLE